MKAQERHDFIWGQIKNKIESAKKEYGIPFKPHQDGYYVQDVNSGDNDFGVYPIRRFGHNVCGMIDCSVFPVNRTIFYKNYGEFERAFEGWIAEVFGKN